MPICQGVIKVPSIRRYCVKIAMLIGLSACVAEKPLPPPSDRFLLEQVRLTYHVPIVSDGYALGLADRQDLAA